VQLLSDADARNWCAHAAPPFEIGSPGIFPLSVRIALPDDAIAIVSLAYVLTITGVDEYAEENFSDSLLWLRRWEIWSESIDRAGYVFLNALRAQSGNTPSLDDAPAHLFGVGEFEIAHACLALPMLFQWDAYFISKKGGIHAFISHERHIDLGFQDETALAPSLARFADWHPVLLR
jgi:hypothetical protein